MGLPEKVEGQIKHLIKYEEQRAAQHKKQYHLYVSDHEVAKKEAHMMHEAEEAIGALDELKVVAKYLRTHLPHNLHDEQKHELRIAFLALRNYTHDRGKIKEARKRLADVYDDLKRAEAGHQHHL